MRKRPHDQGLHMEIGNLAAQAFFLAAGVAAGVRIADDIWAWRESRKRLARSN